MYSYALYGYMAYRLYEYYSIVEYAFYLGRGSRRVYKWFFPPVYARHLLDGYSDWVILHEDGEITENNVVL